MRTRALPVRILFFLVVPALAAPGVLRAGPVTLAKMLQSMVDLEGLCRPPQPGQACRQFSSYDRASTAPGKAGWFANGDAGKFLRKETHAGRTEYVMADMPGPGAVVRVWSANPEGGGTFRLYLDDMETPVIEENFKRLTEAGDRDFPAPFSGLYSRGANLYFPFLFQRHCKLTVSRPGLYYHVDWRSFPRGTRVVPFSRNQLPGVRRLMGRIAEILEHPERGIDLAESHGRISRFSLRPGARLVFPALPGPAEIIRIEMQVPPQAPHLAAILRGTLLTMEFDRPGRPQVCAPLGDFFGSAPGLNPFSTLANGMDARGRCYSNWVMPFRRTARIGLWNTTRYSLPITWATRFRRRKIRAGGDRKTLYFHAKWRAQTFGQTPVFLDWPVLIAAGPGRFTGLHLAVANDGIRWWGEGDEKIWVDGETFPSFFGTGSEDYFGYAWCNTRLFSHAYHAQSLCTGPGNFGYTSVARYHIIDNIPFRRRLRFYIEKWDADPRRYCATAYWYGPRDAPDFFTRPLPVELRVHRVRKWRVKGAVEGETLVSTVRVTAGGVQVQTLSGRFSGFRHLWWTGGKPGAELSMPVPVSRSGRYRVIVGLTRSWDYGIFKILVNGIPREKPVDLYSPNIRPLRLDLGVFTLSRGTLDLRLRCVGSDPRVKARNYMAGIDYVLLRPAP